MKKTAIRFISIILVIVVLFGNLSLIASAEVKEKYPYDCPIFTYMDRDVLFIKITKTAQWKGFIPCRVTMNLVLC